MKIHLSDILLPIAKGSLAVIFGLFAAMETRAQEAELSNAELVKRVQQLENLNRALLSRVEDLENRGPAKDEFADLVNETIDELLVEREETRGGLTSGYSDVRITFQFYGALGFQVGDPPPENGGDSFFNFNTIDFFITAQLGSNLQIVSETILEGDDHEVILDQERLFGVYRVADELYFKLGVEHTLISHWNRIYHHGNWLYDSVGRPTIGSFEDTGGILPSHYAGLELGGHFNIGIGELQYTAVISNGRGPTGSNRQIISDDNDAKALDIAIEFAPAGVDGLSFGGAFRYDVLPEEKGNPLRTNSIQEWIASGFLDWRSQDLEVLAEFVVVNHNDRTSGQEFRHLSGYVQLAYTLGDLTPYIRFDFKNMSRGDPFYLRTNTDLDSWEQIVGVRWDLNDNAALKFEFAFGNQEIRQSGGRIRREDFVTFRFSFVWYF